ncbi:MAG: hypothetical protein H8E51_08650 [Bacteroidetes bacterium]|nr:hypothetical protein [Bacteroidota bacterium]
MSLGGNLTYKDKPILINELTVADLGVYTDGVTGAKMLLFKKHGITIPWATTNTVSLSKTNDGLKKGVLVSISAPSPCEDCNYDYALEIIKKVKRPGVKNDDLYGKSRYYGSDIAAIMTPSGGELTDTDKLTMEDQIITDITNDSGLGQREAGIVDAHRLYIVTVTADMSVDNGAITLTDSAGTATTVTLDGATIGANVHLINNDSTVNVYVEAFAASATTIGVMSKVAGGLFTAADGNDTTEIFPDTRYIVLLAKEIADQFEVRFPKDYATVYPFHLFNIDVTTHTAAGMSVWANGVEMATGDGGIATMTEAGYVADVNTAIAAGGYASLDLTGGSILYIFGLITITTMKVTYTSASNTFVTTWGYSRGQFASLDADEVFEVFSQLRHLGKLTPNVRITQPALASSWNKLVFRNTSTIGNMHGASHSDGYRQEIVLYLIQGYGATDLWDASNLMWENSADAVAGGGSWTADDNINDIITDWGYTITTIE